MQVKTGCAGKIWKRNKPKTAELLEKDEKRQTFYCFSAKMSVFLNYKNVFWAKSFFELVFINIPGGQL